ncbi:MAG TPA: FkbM family methyltransferase [Caulobacteraceae bacterium]
MKAWVRRRLRDAGYDVQGVRYTPRQLLQPELLRNVEFDDVVCRRMFEHGEACVFVQVGAYDGVSTDPLRKYIARCGWRGVMLEPQPRPAEQLRALYQDAPGIVVLQAAVDRARGQRSLYTVECDELPKWAGGMASFDRDHIVRHDYLIPGLAEHIRELKVDCITFDDVLAKLPPGRLDLLQIDAEGADGYLLSLFPFARVRPAIVQWEIKNMSRAQQEATLELLCGHGYRVCRSGGEDMLAVAPASAGGD